MVSAETRLRISLAALWTMWSTFTPRARQASMIARATPKKPRRAKCQTSGNETFAKEKHLKFQCAERSGDSRESIRILTPSAPWGALRWRAD